MARYFLTFINDARPVSGGGHSFVFEPVSNRGGSWLGVLAVEEDPAASILAGIEGVEEISFQRYDDLKKKRTAPRTGSHDSRVRLHRTPASDAAAAAVVEPGGATRGKSIAEAVARPVITSIADIILGKTSKTPPREPILEQPSMKTGKRYRAPENDMG